MQQSPCTSSDGLVLVDEDVAERLRTCPGRPPRSRRRQRYNEVVFEHLVSFTTNEINLADLDHPLQSQLVETNEAEGLICIFHYLNPMLHNR